MFNKSILKNFVSKQLEKQAAEQAKQQAMQQQAMPAPPQQQQIPMAQAGVSVTEDPPEKLVRGFNPNAGVDNNFIESFVTNVTTPGPGGNWTQYQDQSTEGEIKYQLPSDRHFVDPHTWTHADLKNATRVKFQGNIEEEKDLLRKLNRQNFWGARGFRGKGWKAGLSDEEIQEFKEENPFYKKDRVREVSYDLRNTNPSRQIYYNESGRDRFQSGGPNPPAIDPEATETSEGIYYDPIRGAGDTIDGQRYFYPDRANIVYEEDDIYESIFDPRIAEKRAANDAAIRAHEDAVRKREQEIAEIENAKQLYRDVWYTEFPDTTFTTKAERINWLENNPKFKKAEAILKKYDEAPAGANPMLTNKGGFTHTPHYDPTADLTDLYPEEVAPLVLPYDIEYNLSSLPEDVDEGQFRQWINTYYPDYAAEHGIDPTVPRNAMNDIIKSAWYELGNEYNPFVSLPSKEARLPEEEVDLDIIRPEPQEEGPRVVRIDEAGYIPGSYYTPPGLTSPQLRHGTRPGYYNIDTGAYLGEDYVPPMEFSPGMIANLFSKESGGSVRKLKLPKAQEGGFSSLISSMRPSGKFNWGPTDPAERKKLYKYESDQEAPDMILTLKNDKEYIDGIANWASVSGLNMINPEFNDQIKNKLYSGKWGYNPKTGYLVNLAKAKAQDKVTSLPESEKKYLKDRETFWKDEMDDFEKDRVPVTIADTEAWVPDFEFQTFNGTMNALDVMRRNQESGSYGQTVYMTPQEKATYEKKMLQNNWEHTVNHPLWTLPGQIYLGAFAGPAMLANTTRGGKAVLNTAKNIYNKYGRSSKALDRGVRYVTQNSPRAQKNLLKGSKYVTIDNALALKSPYLAYDGARDFYNDPSWANAGWTAYGTAGSLWPFVAPKFMGK